MDLAGMNIRKITDYFRAGCKEDYNRRIGVEIEHFVIKEDNTNATYEEIAELLEAVFGNEQFRAGSPVRDQHFSKKDRTGIRTDLRRILKTNGVLFRTTPYAARNLWLSAVCKSRRAATDPKETI